MRRLLPAALLLGALTACGSSGPEVALAALSLPSGPPGHSQGSATLVTSPDGGIYRNPVSLDVLMVSTVDGWSLAGTLDTTQRWQPLRGLGSFLVVGITLHNDGKAGSDPDLRWLQVASDLAPPGGDVGAAHQLYHPSFPLAALSPLELDSNCQPHLDPGQATTVLLVYPPIRATSVVVWGQYSDFALRLHPGGSAGVMDGSWHAAACDRPQPAA